MLLCAPYRLAAKAATRYDEWLAIYRPFCFRNQKSRLHERDRSSSITATPTDEGSSLERQEAVNAFRRLAIFRARSPCLRAVRAVRARKGAQAERDLAALGAFTIGIPRGTTGVAIMSNDDISLQTGELNWDLYRSDLKVSKMVIQRPRPKLNFEIPVISQSPRYRPGSGPPSQPVDLRPVDDSTAFIVDKVILPLEPFTELGDRRQRRAYYIIGWPDLPAARPVIDCAKALDYVPPFAIEQWEHDDFLRRESDKEQAETEAALNAVAEAIAAEKGEDVGADGLPNKKKPGRKPKKARVKAARPPTPQLDSEQEKLLAKRMQGPSLSTPQKRKSRIAQLEAELEMEPLDHTDADDESDEEIRRQLEGERLHREEDDTGFLRAASDVADSFRASSKRLAAPEDRMLQTRDNRSIQVPQSRRVSPTPSSSQQQVSSDSVKLDHLSQTKRPISTTPIPLPRRPNFGPTSSFAPTAGPPATPLIETSTSSGQGRAKATHSPTAALRPDSNVVQTPSLKAALTSNGNHGGFTPTNSFTPVGGYFPRPPKRTADESPLAGGSNEGTPSTGKVKRERKKKVPKLLQHSPHTELAAGSCNEPQVEQEYVVKRLEGDSIVDGIQYFLVRWEGDWPPEQNPTWEPRENISAKLVKAYLKRKAEKVKNTPAKSKETAGSSKGKSKEKQQSTLKEWASKLNYSSVSEAFEGQAELDQLHGKTDRDRGLEDDDELGGDADEFLVVDKRKAEERAKAAAERRKSLSSQVAAQFANVGPGRPSGF
ncbi:hypothetical protein N0V93_003673 [Gnomoniopsis smithogilvyi]|uniref:Chromo domain-containing protein n=1 Tax=Gnomoniopsis smithogilvyi TaxID=1191159 RepID=A0A9W8YX33_9PEZI|nr:hypothetical protein N0V93_003673 [Gnomoniopsis smithogilvyi]